MILPITKSSRKYGYIIWSKKNNSIFEQELGDIKSVNVYLNGFYLGEKNIDWKFFRISIGYKFTRALPSDVKNYIINFEENTLKVECK